MFAIMFWAGWRIVRSIEDGTRRCLAMFLLVLVSLQVVMAFCTTFDIFRILPTYTMPYIGFGARNMLLHMIIAGMIVGLADKKGAEKDIAAPYFSRQNIYRWLVKCHIIEEKTAQRQKFVLTNQALIDEINGWLCDNPEAMIEEMTAYVLDLTSRTLAFRFRKSEVDPNLLYPVGITHCIGYASFFRSVLHYLITSRDLNDHYRVDHLVVKVCFCGINIYWLTRSRWLADHDINAVFNLKDGGGEYIDPSLYDYTGIRSVRASGGHGSFVSENR